MVEPFRMAHEMGGQNINVVLIGANAGKFLGHVRETLVPIGHGEHNAVRLGGRGDVALTGGGKVKRIAQDSIAAAPREHRFLHHPDATRCQQELTAVANNKYCRRLWAPYEGRHRDGLRTAAAIIVDGELAPTIDTCLPIYRQGTRLARSQTCWAGVSCQRECSSRRQRNVIDT